MSSVTMVGADEVADLFRSMSNGFSRIGRSWLRDNSIDTINTVHRHVLSVGAVDTMQMLDSIYYEIKTTPSGLKSTIRPDNESDPRAVFTEYGTKPHKAPIDALRPWADRHGIPVGAVWHKIATEGTDPRFWARDSFEEIKPDVLDDAPRLVDRLIRGV